MRWKVLLPLFALLVPPAVRAEDATVFSEADTWKLYTTPQASVTELGDQSTVLGGLGIGTILNDQWRFGLQVRTQLDEVTVERSGLTLSTWDYWDYGLDLGYIFAPASLVHVDAGLFLGGGKIEPDRDSSESTDFAVIEPSVAACLNLHETWELGLRLGWRWTDGLSIRSLDDDDADELVLTLFFRATQF